MTKRMKMKSFLNRNFHKKQADDDENVFAKFK